MKLYKVWVCGREVELPFPGRYAGISTQKIFGRLDCWSGKKALAKNRVFFLFWEDAIEAGYRPCRHCRPDRISRRGCDHLPYQGLPSLRMESAEDPRFIVVRCCACGADVTRIFSIQLINGRVTILRQT